LCSGSGKKTGKLKATLDICGDPITGRALTLLLRSSGYASRFLLSRSFEEPLALKDVRLLVLTPTPQLSTERRDALVTLLKETSEGMNMPVLELVTPHEAGRREEVASESWHAMPWPCRLEELEWRIDAAWLRHNDYETRGETSGNKTNVSLRL
jgi:hypothetical protein